MLMFAALVCADGGSCVVKAMSYEDATVAGQIKCALEVAKSKGQPIPVDAPSLVAGGYITSLEDLNGTIHKWSDYSWTIAFHENGRYAGTITIKANLQREFPQRQFDYSNSAGPPIITPPHDKQDSPIFIYWLITAAIGLLVLGALWFFVIRRKKGEAA